MRPLLRLFAFASPFLLAGVARAQHVWLVAKYGGFGDFTDIPEAVAAASDGDVLLVTSGHYSRLEIDGKGLIVIGLPGTDAEVEGLIVSNVPATSRVLVRGMRVSPLYSFTSEATAMIRYADGPVWLEDCKINQDFLPPTQGTLGLDIASCKSVTIVNCVVKGNPATVWIYGVNVGAGMQAWSSTVVAQRSTFVGAKGYSTGMSGSTPHGPSDGGAGVVLFKTPAYFYDCVITGGDGGGGAFLAGSCFDGADGGPGLLLPSWFSLNKTAYASATTIAGGAAGDGSGGCASGAPGQAVVVEEGAVVDVPLADPPRTMQAASTIHELSTLDLTFDGGAPGELVLVGVSPGPMPTGAFLPAAEGAVVLGPPIVSIVAGAMPATGPFVASFPLPALPPGVEARALFLQSVHVGATPHLGTGTAVVVSVASP